LLREEVFFLLDPFPMLLELAFSVFLAFLALPLFAFVFKGLAPLLHLLYLLEQCIAALLFFPHRWRPLSLPCRNFSSDFFLPHKLLAEGRVSKWVRLVRIPKLLNVLVPFART